MPKSSAPTVGVVNHPEVAQALRELGFKVLTAEGFRDAATQISGELQSGPFPVVAAESDVIGFGPWASSVARKTDVILLRTRPELGLVVTGAQVVDLPATVNTIMPLLGYQASLHPSGEFVITAAFPVPVVTAAPEPLALTPAPTPLDIPTALSVVAGFETPQATPTGPAGLNPIFRTEDDETTAAGPDTSPAPAAVVVDNGDFDEALFGTVAMPAAPVPAIDHVSAQPFTFELAPQATETRVDDFETQPTEVDQSAAAPAWEPPAAAIADPEAVARYIPLATAPDPATTVAPPLAELFTAPHPTAAEQFTAAVMPPVEDDFFTARTARAPISPVAAQSTYRPGAARGQLVIFFSGKGGVGKTSSALFAAKTAAAAGLRGVLIDANRGQADVRTYLGLPKEGIPTVYDAVRTGDPSAALVLPAVYNAYRHTSEPLDFALVQGPPRRLADPAVVTAEVYGEVIDYARSQADLVVLDTQILEAHKSDLFDRLIIPAMLSGAWSVAIVNESRAGVDNLLESFSELAERGVTNAHSLIIASLYEQFDDFDQQAIERKYGQYGTFAGSIGIDPAVRDALNLGNVYAESPAVQPVIRNILHRVTGNPVFAPLPEVPKRKRGFLGRRRGDD